MTNDERLKHAISGMVDARLLGHRLILENGSRDKRKNQKTVWRLWRYAQAKDGSHVRVELARWGIHARINRDVRAIEYEEALKILTKYKKHLREITQVD